jgi:outer membrane protein assembly factor BamB
MYTLFNDKGNVIVGNNDNFVYSFNGDTGEVNWKYQTNAEVPQSPVIGSDGVVYIPDESGALFAINPDGTTKWKRDAPPAAKPVDIVTHRL